MSGGLRVIVVHEYDNGQRTTNREKIGVDVDVQPEDCQYIETKG